MPSLCKIKRSDIIHIQKEGNNASGRLDGSSAWAGGSDASPLQVHPLFAGIPATGKTPLKNNVGSSVVVNVATSSDSDRRDAGSSPTTKGMLDADDDEDEDKENTQTLAASNADAAIPNEKTKVHNRPKKKRKMTLDAYFITPSTRFENDSISDDEESITETENNSSKKIQRTSAKLLSLNDDAKPINVRIPFVGNMKYVEVRITSHGVKNKYIDKDDEPIVLSGEMMYPACSRVAIERFLPGFGRYIH